MVKEDIVEKFKEIDKSGYPDFYSMKTPLEMGLWVLLVVDEELKIDKLTAEDIAEIITIALKKSMTFGKIINSFNALKKKYIHRSGNYYMIMKEGKDHILSIKSYPVKNNSVTVLHFEHGKKYTSNKELSEKILKNLEGELRIFDAYCDTRTLDIIYGLDNKIVKFLTKMDNIRNVNSKSRFLTHLSDLKSEKPGIEFKDYVYSDIHDRFIISSDALVIIGHSIKDLGASESFAVKLDKKLIADMYDTVKNNFDERWKISNTI